jgi:chromosome partitioning protein
VIKHPIITVATLKGGSGKSTVASCLAVQWKRQGRQPVIIDADPQRSIVRLAARECALDHVPVIEDDRTTAATARRHALVGDPVIIDTAGFRTEATLNAISIADLVIVPVKPSPLDVAAMEDTALLLGGGQRRPPFVCLLTQTTRDSVIARHIREELRTAGYPLLDNELPNRVIYGVAALYGATPAMLYPQGVAAREIEVLVQEIDSLLSTMA